MITLVSINFAEFQVLVLDNLIELILKMQSVFAYYRYILLQNEE